MKYGSLLMVLCILLQGCSAYRKWTVSLESAAQSKSRVRVHTVDGQTWKFKQILAEEDGFYGVKKDSGEEVIIPLDSQNIKAVHLRKRGMAYAFNGTGLLIAIPVAILSYVILNNVSYIE